MRLELHSLHVIGGHSIGIAFSKLCAQEPRRLIDNNSFIRSNSYMYMYAHNAHTGVKGIFGNSNS